MASLCRTRTSSNSILKGGVADNYDFCVKSVEEAAEAAKSANLQNVRECELRAEKTWRGLADHARAVAVQRERIEREKAEQQGDKNL